MSGVLPLSALLSQCLVAFIIEFDNEFERRMPHRTTNHDSTGSGPRLLSMAMWSTCMRFVTERGVSVGELSALARTETNLNGMERWGYIVSDAPGVPGRAKRFRRDSIIRSTAKGRKAQEIWQPLFDVIEARWVERFGAVNIAELRQALLLVANQIEFDLPDCPPILGYGLFSGAADYKRKSPARELSEFSGLPLAALLSKVLLLFAMDYERDRDVSLAIGANVLRLEGDEGTLMRDLPRVAGVSKEAIATALSFLERRGYACMKTDPTSRTKIFELTAKGREARDAYSDRMRSIEESWSDRFGADVARRLRPALEELVGEEEPSPLLLGIEPYPEGWRAALPRPERLSHFPMILHRGGFPDGN